MIPGNGGCFPVWYLFSNGEARTLSECLSPRNCQRLILLWKSDHCSLTGSMRRLVGKVFPNFSAKLAIPKVTFLQPTHSPDILKRTTVPLKLLSDFNFLLIRWLPQPSSSAVCFSSLAFTGPAAERGKASAGKFL